MSLRGVCVLILEYSAVVWVLIPNFIIWYNRREYSVLHFSMTTITIANPLVEQFFLENFGEKTQELNTYATQMLANQITLLNLKKGVSEAKNNTKLEDLDSFLTSQGA